MTELIWPPDLPDELRRRYGLAKAMRDDPKVTAGAWLACKADPLTFVRLFVWTYEPRNANLGLPTRIPVVPFPRQAEFIAWMHDRFTTRERGYVDKSRDSGATWMACSYAVWLWLFHQGAAVGFGSRKETLVDLKGDPGSLFGKIRLILDRLPPSFLPAGFDPREHSNHMRLVNPANGSTIIGEAGDNIGRGGRTSLYIVDEAAHVERPQMIEASLSANTDVRIDISSPLAGSLFSESVPSAAPRQVFVFDITDAPWHTPDWIAEKRRDLESKGLGHLFAQEYLRDPTAAIEGQLIPGIWIESAIDAAIRLDLEPSGEIVAGLDVADGGRDANAFGLRRGVHVLESVSRPDIKADAAGHWALDLALRAQADRMLYDSIGVGAGVAAVARARQDLEGLAVLGWSAAGAVLWPKLKYAGNRRHADMFANAKAQSWWLLRERFRRTHEAVTQFERDGTLPDDFDPDEIVSIDRDCTALRELKSELAQISYTHNGAGKIVINKAPEGKRSPNIADAMMICFAPTKAPRPIAASLDRQTGEVVLIGGTPPATRDHGPDWRPRVIA